MHRKYTLFSVLAALLLPASLLAQPVLTAANSNPVIGDSFVVSSFYEWAGFNPGPAGANVTWDFSQLQPKDSTQHFYQASSGHINAAQYPGAPMYAHYYYIMGYKDEFYIPDASSLSTMGGEADPWSEFQYNRYNVDSKKLLEYPLTFNSRFTDTFAAQVLEHPATYYSATGKAAAHADAYGTLKLPYGQINDVLRVVYTDTVHNNSSTHIGTFVNTTYRWYQAGTHVPVLVVFDGSRNTMPYYGGAYTRGHSVVTAVAEAAAPLLHLAVYPNPASKSTRVAINVTEPGPLTLTLYSSLGQQVRQLQTGHAAAGVLNQEVPLEGLPKGVYHLTVRSATATRTTRLLVE